MVKFSSNPDPVPESEYEKLELEVLRAHVKELESRSLFWDRLSSIIHSFEGAILEEYMRRRRE